MRLLSEAVVERLIDPAMAIKAAEAAYRMQSARAAEPGRMMLRQDEPPAGLLALAAFAGDTLVVKTNVHAQPAGGHRTGGSLVTLWDAARAVPLALIAALAFNGHRTAAGFAAAARLLAAPDAGVLVIFGAGRLAAPTLRYLIAVRPIHTVLLVGRDPRRSEALAAEAAKWPGFADVRVEACRNAADAAARADIIATTTTSAEPVFPGAAVRPGTLVILGGANRANAREADDALIRRARITPDHRAGALAKSGDLAIPLATGVIGADAIGPELGVLLDAPPGPPPSGFVSVFKSIGVAPQDLTLACALLARAEALGLGPVFDWEGA